MTIWIFMMIMCLLTPIILIGFGSAFCHKPPHDINSVVGYRTPRSTRNKDTWAFAHAYFGVIAKRMGWIQLVLSLAVMLVVLGQNEELVGRVGSMVMVAQVISLIASIFPTEAALKRTFNEKGERRTKAE